MITGHTITIYYRNGKEEEHYCDSYEKKNGLLTYYVRFGTESGQHCIPYDLIEKFEIKR